MKRRFHNPVRPAILPGGFSLVEVMMALGISAFAMTTLMALVPIGLSSNSDSRGAMEAMNVAREIAADLRVAALVGGTHVSPKFAARLDNTSVEQHIEIPGSVQGASGHRVALQVLPTSPPTGKEGYYEVAVRVFWGLADPSQPAPDKYSKFVDLYVGVTK